MSKYLRKTNGNHEGNGEYYFERQALIDDQELCDDEINLFSATSTNDIRKRQSSNLNRSTNFSDDQDHELRNIKTRDLISEPVIEFTHYEIQEGDSLQSICLRFACSINQVKRFNGLMNDQDFYALRKIKLPLGKFGLLEDYIKSQQSENTNPRISDQSSFQKSQSKTTINSPGSALHVSTRRTPNFKPLLSPGLSTDNLDCFNGILSEQSSTNNSTAKLHHNHSNSFSSLREFQEHKDVNIVIDQQSPQPTTQNSRFIDTNALKQQSFIKPDINVIDNPQLPDTDDLLTADLSTLSTDKVEKVFKDLDYHVERAKALAESYDQRATELVNQIDDGKLTFMENVRHVKVSKMPQLFFCSENFGLNYKKLIVFIVVVCLVAPLVYICETDITTNKLR